MTHKERMKQLLLIVAPIFDAQQSDMLRKCRLQEVVLARYAVFLFLRRKRDWKLERIAKSLPFVYHHSSVINALNSIDGWMQYELDTRERVEFAIAEMERAYPKYYDGGVPEYGKITWRISA